MAIFHYENLTHSELAGLARDKTVVMFAAGPLEEHSLHLPLGTDPMVADYFTRLLAQEIVKSRADWNVLILPPFFIGVDALNYLGTINVSSSVLREVFYAHCKKVAQDGFKFIIAASAHGGPRHNVVLEELANRMAWRHRVQMIAVSSRMLYEVLSGKFRESLISEMKSRGTPLSVDEEQALEHDYHAGFLETSVMMVVRPDLVKPIYRELKPAIVDKIWKAHPNSGKKVGDGLGHLGSPSFARKDLGEAAIALFLRNTMPFIDRFLSGEKGMQKVFRSPFYWIPFFRTDFKFIAYIAVYTLLFFALLGAVHSYLAEFLK